MTNIDNKLIVKHFYKFLKIYQIEDKYIYNFFKFYKRHRKINATYDDLFLFIINRMQNKDLNGILIPFPWNFTKEGYEFWNKIYHFWKFYLKKHHLNYDTRR